MSGKAAITINMVGCGRVGRVIGRLLAGTTGVVLQDVITRSLATAQQAVSVMGAGHAVPNMGLMRHADLWLLGTSDQHLCAAAQALAQHWKAAGNPINQAPRDAPIAVHFSGALASTELAALAQPPLGWRIASAHPVLSFAQHDVAVQQFAGTPVALEGDPVALEVLHTLLTRLGGRCFPIQADNKMRYHAAAVFASNFVPVIQQTALDLWAASGVPSEILSTLWPRMLQNACHNTLALGPVQALTGPAARGDMALVERQHQSVQQWHPVAGDAYRALSELARQMAGNPTGV